MINLIAKMIKFYLELCEKIHKNHKINDFKKINN